jgi:two-component system, cell cycle sensor histidine kinase and response regulator CckA
MGVATQTAVGSFRPDELDVVLAAFEAAAESLLVVENDLILLANPACVELFGCGELAALAGQPLNRFFPPHRFCGELFHSSPNGNQSNHCEHPSCELTVLRPDGGEVRVSARCTRFVFGNRALVLAALHEADRKRSEEHLREAENMEVIGRLAGGVAHDFNNLLTGILLYCDLLLHELDPGNRLRQHVEEVRMAGEQGAALTQQLLAIARKQVPQPRPILLNQVVASTENLLRRLIGEHIELVTFLELDLGPVLADQAQLRQVILNLALNARDAMPHGGRITLRTCGKTLTGTSQAAVALVVEDTGCGMDAPTRARLFEPFFTTKQPGRGTGLGLATVQRIVKEAGGVIVVESEPGRGTRIEVLLPITSPTALPTMPSLAEVKSTGDPQC